MLIVDSPEAFRRLLGPILAEEIHRAIQLGGAPTGHVQTPGQLTDGPWAFTVRKAARTMGVSVSTIRRRIADGTLATTRIGGRVLIPIGEVARVLRTDSSV